MIRRYDDLASERRAGQVFRIFFDTSLYTGQNSGLCAPPFHSCHVSLRPSRNLPGYLLLLIEFAYPFFSAPASQESVATLSTTPPRIHAPSPPFWFDLPCPSRHEQQCRTRSSSAYSHLSSSTRGSPSLTCSAIRTTSASSTTCAMSSRGFPWLR